MKKTLLHSAALPVIAAFFMLALPSCKKKDEHPQPVTKTKILTQTGWNYSKFELQISPRN